jgi:hypothetical protein
LQQLGGGGVDAVVEVAGEQQRAGGAGAVQHLGEVGAQGDGLGGAQA